MLLCSYFVCAQLKDGRKFVVPAAVHDEDNNNNNNINNNNNQRGESTENNVNMILIAPLSS